MSIPKDSPTLSTESAISEQNTSFFCFYKNHSPKIQVLRLLNSPESWERVIFPQERLLFEATLRSKLEVQRNQYSYEVIPCVSLKINK